MGQVIHHRESTERQYALKTRAAQLGWPAEQIKILDGDLGLSGAQMSNREDFKLLVADVTLEKVGAIFALEASRLSRSSNDWNRLFELCSIAGTLIIDEDGCYDPCDFNDQLLLGLKGIMSQAELHFIRGRLLGGKINKAKKGELRFPLPVGFCYDEEGKIVLDPDEEVRGTIELFFELFKKTGSAYGVVREFGGQSIQFPKRAYGGIWKGKLIWGQLTYTRALMILKNPVYSGTYVYGRYKYKKSVLPDGSIAVKVIQVPLESWFVRLNNHHAGYISWDEYLHNKSVLSQNLTNGAETMLSSAVREGLALLQGILICGICGHRLTVRYQGNGGIYPIYECCGQKKLGLTDKACMRFRCNLVDDIITTRIFEVLKKDQIEIAIKAVEELEKRNKTLEKQWKMKIERAGYEVLLAQKRYEEVDPANRLVAATLEKRWDDALVNLEQIKQQYTEYQLKHNIDLPPEKKEKMLMLAQDIPNLWKTSSTPDKDRKRIIRLLIKDITVEKVSEQKKLILHIRWQGGVNEDITCKLPPKMCDKIRYPHDIIEQVKEFSKIHIDDQIAELFNQKGLRSAKGKPFTVSMIKWIRHKYNIPSPELKTVNELTIKEVARKFDVSTYMVYYWIDKGYVNARRIKPGHPYWITLTPAKEGELRARIKNSYKLNKTKHS
jgi:DNA invertase Pin-like site-specific DNA recombinase